MFDSSENTKGNNTQRKVDAPGGRLASANSSRNGRVTGSGHGFSKIFRWQPSDPNAAPPASVQLVGSFTNWRAVQFVRDAATNTWQIQLQGIPGNQTHRYMLLVDGKPTSDKNSDGLAVPQDAEEKKFQLITPRGPRVFLLFAQTK
ncbi:MAG: hypothetical protein ABSE48_18055 [Verrucomicrobiota bacterium]